MKNSLLTLILLSSCHFAAIGYGQEPQPIPVYRGERLISVNNLHRGTDCLGEMYTGTISRISGEYPDIFLDVRIKRGTKRFWLNTGELSMADNGNLYYWIVKKGKRVRIRSFTCGSGAFVYVGNISSF